MPDLAELSNLHLLRPAWLLGLVPVAWLYWVLRRRTAALTRWQQAIAPHLLKHLTVASGDKAGLRPYQVLTIATVFGLIGAAGPAWEREPTPFTEDRAPLVIALELTPGMLAIDQPPTRLDRARQKISDLLDNRQGARTAIVAYAGSAHTVLPLTDDPDLIRLYLDSLGPERMPVEGDAPDRALNLAADLIADSEVPGSILFMTDGIDASYTERFGEFASTSPHQLLYLGFGSEDGGPTWPSDGSDPVIAPGLDRAGLEAVAAASGTSLLTASLDESDLSSLARRIRTHLTNAINADEELQWRDAGYLLTWPMALLVLLWFRRGWTVQWT